MATFRQAIITHLREDTGSGGLLEALDNDTTRIKPRGLVKAEATFPMVSVEIAHRAGSPRDLPNVEQVFHIYAYTRADVGRNVRDLVTIDNLLDRAMKRLHGAIISDFSTSIDEDFKPFQVWFDGYASRDLFDALIRADYRWMRFRTYGIQSTDPRN